MCNVGLCGGFSVLVKKTKRGDKLYTRKRSFELLDRVVSVKETPQSKNGRLIVNPSSDSADNSHINWGLSVASKVYSSVVGV